MKMQVNNEEMTFMVNKHFPHPHTKDLCRITELTKTKCEGQEDENARSIKHSPYHCTTEIYAELLN